MFANRSAKKMQANFQQTKIGEEDEYGVIKRRVANLYPHSFNNSPIKKEFSFIRESAEPRFGVKYKPPDNLISGIA